MEHLDKDEADMIRRLLAGDETAFEWLVTTYHSSLVRLARLFLTEPSAIDEVIQETWIAVLRGLKGFEGRSSLKTWLSRILANKAKSYTRRQRLELSFEEADDDGPTVSPERFYGADAGDKNGEWRLPPIRWENIPEQNLLSQEILATIQRAIEGLSPYQRLVITLRDIYQFSTDEICDLMGISSSNQRVLLHRARAKVRQALEDYWRDD